MAMASVLALVALAAFCGAPVARVIAIQDDDIAATIFAALDMPRRVLWPEVAVFATNPWAEG